MAAASGQNGAIGVAPQKFSDCGHALRWHGQVVEAKFKETLSRVILRAGVRQQLFGIWKSESDANFWERGPPGH